MQADRRLFVLPDIDAAVVGLALFRCVRGYRVVLALVVEGQSAAVHAIVLSVLRDIVDAALREVFVVLLRSIGIRVADELERGVRMSLGDSDEVRELLRLGSQRRVDIRSEVDAVEIVVVVDMLRYDRRLDDRSDWLRDDRSRCWSSLCLVAAEAIAEADKEAAVLDVVVVVELRVEVTIARVEIPVVVDRVSEAGFPERRLLRAEGAICVEGEVLRDVELRCEAELCDIVGDAVRAVDLIGTAEVVVDAVPADKDGRILAEAVSEVYL